MTERGRRRQGQKLTERVNILVSPELRQALERQAAVDDRSMGDVARKLLVERLLPPVEEKA